MTRTLAGLEMGLVKLAEEATAMAIIAVYGDIPSCTEDWIAIGDISTTSADVGMIVVAKDVTM